MSTTLLLSVMHMLTLLNIDARNSGHYKQYLTMTQSCSCCRCQKWCSANVCFAGLRKQNTKAHFAGIEFSADSPLLSKEAKPSSSHTILSTSDSDGDTDPSTALAKSYDFVQKKSKFGFHPQIGVPPIKPIVQQPQTKQPGAFTTRFHCVDVKSTPHVSLGLDSSLSVYREESTTPLNGARDSKDTAIIQFSLHYDVAQSKLTIHLQHATNLPRMYDTNGYPVQCDPLVVLHLEPERGDTLQSQVVKCTYNPVFNEMFYFRGLSRDHLRYQVLVFRIYNGALSNRAIGKASLPLVDVDLLGIVLQMIVRTKEVEV